ncbi:MAG: sensor histidine kinase, partial [Flavobacteriales bacterium]
QNKLEALNKELNTFVYKASHDLKGPLASISGLTHMGLERVQDENAAQYFEMIQASVKRLDDTLIELLELSKSTNATIHLEEIDIKAFINSIQESVSHAEYSKGIEIKKEILIKQKIFTDKDILTSSLQNLLINAMKYHRREEPKKWIRIKAYNADTNKGIFITVEDNGTGIPDEIKDKIFNMFYRGNEASDGTGLGLYIVKKNVEKLGGEITLKDSKSGGALFSIYLPN